MRNRVPATAGKGQFNIEYLVALIIFISILIFLSIQLAQAVPEFHTESVSNRLRAQAYRVTDGLMKTPGEPEEWHLTNATRYGFANKPYEINTTKVQTFQTLCTSSYEQTKQTLGLEPQADFQMIVLINSTSVVNCGRERVPLEAVQILVRRTGFTTDRTLVEMTFRVWT